MSIPDDSSLDREEFQFVPKVTVRTIADLYGPGLTDLENSQLIDRDYGVDLDWHCTFYNSRGHWRLTRNEYNDRGDIGSVRSRCVAIGSIGVLDTKVVWAV